VQLDPRLTLGCPWVACAWSHRLKLKYGALLSNVAFKFNLRCYGKVCPVTQEMVYIGYNLIDTTGDGLSSAGPLFSST